MWRFHCTWLTRGFTKHGLILEQRDERVLIVWSDDLDTILGFCSDFETKLVKLVWRSRTTGAPSILSNSGSTSVAPSTTASDVNLTEKPALAPSSSPLAKDSTPKATSKSKWSWWKLSKKAPAAPTTDLEKGTTAQSRPTKLFAPFYSGFGAGLSICMCCWFENEAFLTYLPIVFIGSGLSILIQEYRLDSDWRRFFLLVTTPFLFCVSLVSLTILMCIKYSFTGGSSLPFKPCQALHSCK